jgi:UDP-glucose 4-epimerase
MKETILVTGGAGYIGSAAVKALISKGYNVIVVDNLTKGKKELVDKKATFYEIDLTNKEKLSTVFNEKIDYVMHFASYKAVGESMKNPEKYSDNITGTINLLDLMVEHNIKKIIYSSSAAVYGIPIKVPINEDHPTDTINYYGYTKLTSEKIIDWYSTIHGINYISLRYFNIAGDFELNYIDPEAQNIFPIIMEVIFKKRDKLTIFGDDYDTRDGTCVRDYIDIHDLIDAHILALNINENQIINLGTSNGTSVKELVSAIIEVTGKDFPYEIGEKREGDPATLVASNKKAKEILNWEPKKDIKDMIKTTFDAYNNSQK